ncbi:hypothetical protein KIW84_UN0720 [Lathyrus oleraceus]|nr:hypothetical protein KIW84_UN0720 [Pisum sativum]
MSNIFKSCFRISPGIPSNSSAIFRCKSIGNVGYCSHNGMDIIMDTCEAADRKPSQDSAPTSVQIEDDFRVRLYISSSRSDIPAVNVADLPVLEDAFFFSFKSSCSCAWDTRSSIMNSSVGKTPSIRL